MTCPGKTRGYSFRALRTMHGNIGPSDKPCLKHDMQMVSNFFVSVPINCKVSWSKSRWASLYCQNKMPDQAHISFHGHLTCRIFNRLLVSDVD